MPPLIPITMKDVSRPIRLNSATLVQTKEELKSLPEGKLLINCINAHSYNIAQKDTLFNAALNSSDYLLPDGISIVYACKYLKAKSQPEERITGWDLFLIEMNRLNKCGGKCMFMGSSEKVLCLIKERAAKLFPNIAVDTYSPPYKSAFSPDDSQRMVAAINNSNPDLLWIGMTAPKQEKWTYEHWNELHIRCHTGTVGAVFDFFAGTAKRAPLSWRRHGLEWLYRVIHYPKHIGKRVFIGNNLFIWNILTKEQRTPRANKTNEQTH